MLRKYQKIGLRQDKNLSDLDNKSLALDNLLNNLSGNFNGRDVKSAIDGLKNTSVELEDIYNLGGIAIKDSDFNPVPVIVTIQDHINNYRVFSGNPAFARGGQGLPAKFIQGSKVISDFSSSSIKGDQLFTGQYDFQELNFWDDGYFFFDTKLHPFLPNQYGMIQWEGYVTNTTTLSIVTSGFYLIEYNTYQHDGDSNPYGFTTVGSRLAVSRSTTTEKTAAVTESTFTLPVIDNISLAVGDRLVTLNTVDVFNDNITITDIEIGETSTTVTLSTSVDFVINTNTLVFEYDFGNEETTGRCYLPSTAVGDKLKVRFTVWWPDPSTTSTNCFNAVKFPVTNAFSRKYIRFASSSGSYTHYANFYESYTRPNDILSLDGVADESFEQFYKGALRNTAPLMQQKNMVSSESIRLDLWSSFVPPAQNPPQLNVAVDDVHYDIGTVTRKGPYKLEGDFTNAEIGDFLVFNVSGDIYVLQIAQLEGTQYAYTNTFTNTASYSSVKLVKAYGLIGIYNFTSSLGTSLVFNANGFEVPPPAHYNDITRVKPDMFVCTQNNGTDFARLTEVTVNGAQPGQLVTTYSNFNGRAASISSGPDSLVLVYARRALEDTTNAAKCERVSYVEVAATANSGANTFTVLDASNVANGDYVQFSGIIPAGATVTVSGNTLTLSSALTANLSQGFAVTVIPSDKYEAGTDYEVCTIPPNTAPPFVGTLSGLATDASGNYKLKTSDLKANNLTLNGMTVNQESSTTYTEVLKVYSGSDTYQLLLK